MTTVSARPRVPGRRLVVWGMGLLVAALYALTSPGRIDMIDGQFRFDVALSLVETGRPVLRDRAIRFWGTQGRGEQWYSGYEIGASVAALPLVALGGLADDPHGETRRFLFALTGPLLGGCLAAYLVGVLLDLGLSLRRAALWTAAIAFATLLWPASTSVFDQSQHALFVTVGMVEAWRAGRARTRREGLWHALLSGAAVAVLVNYRSVYLPLIPFFALPLWGSQAPWARSKPQGATDGRISRWPAWPSRIVSERLIAFGALALLGVAAWLAINQWRFGAWFVPQGDSGAGGHPALVVRPWWGLVGYLISPGKSVLLFTPALVLAFFGWRSFARREPGLARGTLAFAVAYVAIVASLPFWAGDWCWGPRYLVAVMPLLMLAAPFQTFPRWAVRAILGLSLCVQGLGLAVDHHRFFYERALENFFWAEGLRPYFEHSQFTSRPGEIVSMVLEGVPPEARWFAPGPYPGLLTYCVFGNRDRAESPTWMRQFGVFYLPRPWPLWMTSRHLGDLPRPVDPVRTMALLASVGLLGGLLIRRGVATAED